MVDRWKEFHWLYIETRGVERPHMGRVPRHGLISMNPRMPMENPGQNGQESNRTTTPPSVRERLREEARKDLWWDIAIPDYTDLVDAVVGERVSIAAEMIKPHLSINIRMCHALQKKERWAVGKDSLPDDITRAEGLSRRPGDQIAMIRCVQGRIGEDRDAILDMHHRPDLLPEEGPPSALSKDKGRAVSAAGECDSEPVPKRAKTSIAMQQRS
jgi:hypothetical protein